MKPTTAHRQTMSSRFRKGPRFLQWMILFFFLRVVQSKFVRNGMQPTVQRTLDNYWPFDFSTGFTDIITGNIAHVHGNHTNISIRGLRYHNGYLFIKDLSSIELHGLKTSCFSNPFECKSGVSIVIWFRDLAEFHVTYFKSSSGAFSLERSLNNSLVVRIANKTTINKSSFWVNTSVWNHIAITWDLTSGLAIYSNSRRLSIRTQILYTNSSLIQNKLQNSRTNSLFLHGKASYDDVMIWHKTLSPLEMKKIFQSQISSILNASCDARTTSLNVTWRHSLDIYNTIASYYVRLRKGKKTRKIDAYKLSKTATNVVFNNLLPMTSYRIKIWAETENDDIIKTEVVKCRTEEGEPERVINFKATPILSSTVLIEWIPPARINGLLKGYQVNVSDSTSSRSIFVYGKQSYLIEKLKESTTFTIEIAAVNGRGPGLPSSVTVRTKKVPIIRTSPEGLQATAKDWEAIHLKWIPMSPAMEVAFYEVRVCNNTICIVKDSKRTSILVRGLQQYTGYKVQIRATNNRSTGPWVMLRKFVYTLDLDECKEQRHTCSRYASCHNIRGSYLCTCLPGYGGNGTFCTKIDPRSINTCQFQITEGLSWHWTVVGQQTRILCPKGTEGIAERFCDRKDGKAAWRPPNLEGCISKRILDIQNRLLIEDLDEGVITDISYELSQATNLTNGMMIYGGDVITIVKIIKKLDEITGKNTSGMEEYSQRLLLSNIVKVASNILDAVAMKSWKQIPTRSRVSDASQLLDSLDSITMGITSLLTAREPVIQSAPNVVVNMQSFVLDQMVGYAKYPLVTLDSNSIALPLDDIRQSKVKKGNKTYVSFIYLKNIGPLLTANDGFDNNTEDKQEQTASPVVISLSTSPKPTKIFKKPVVITLKNPQHKEDMGPLCVYWNQSKTTKSPGSWSAKGCSVNSSNVTHTVCHCNHLTSFSVLMQYKPVEHLVSNQHNFALSMITYIGIGVSILALFLALITFTGCPFLKSTRNFAHINLTLSLLLAEVLFLTGIDKTHYILPCQVIAIFLHYLFLVVFCWMASEGIILYFMLVRVFPSETSGPRKRLFFICSWGLPGIFVGFTSSFYFQGYGNNRYCWLSIDDGFIWSFLAPVLLVSLVNLIFLSMTFKAMANRSTPQSANKKSKFKHWVKACAVLTCLLGTTWLLGLFYINKNSLVMAYLFNIFNSLQGLLIFIFHCVFDERVRSEYYRILCCRGSRRDHLRKKSTGTLTFRKLTSGSSATQMRKIHQSSTDEKGTFSGYARNDLDSSQNIIQDVFDSDSLLTINKTSADEHCVADEHEPAKPRSRKTPIVDICSDTEHDSADYTKQKEKSWGEHLTESLFNVSSLEEWESRSSKRISRPLSEDTSGLSLPRSKEYYSDGDYTRYTADYSDAYHSENERGSHPIIKTDKGTVIKLGRCKICSNDSYHMVCVHDDAITQSSLEYVEESPLQHHLITDPSYSSSITVPSARVSFDESILTGYLRDQHPNPKIINYRWTHIPYIKKPKEFPKETFMSESASCDDRYLRSQGNTSNSMSLGETLPAKNAEKVCSMISLHEENTDKNELYEADFDLAKHENLPTAVKPVGLVAPIMASVPAPEIQQEDTLCPPVALAESVDELRDLDSEHENETETKIPEENIENKTNKPLEGKYKSSIQVKICSQPKRNPLQNDKLPRIFENKSLPHPLPSTFHESGCTSPNSSRKPQITTVPKNEMTTIKQGIVQRLGQVFESGWQKLHAHNSECDTQKKGDNDKKRSKSIEKAMKPVPGKVKNLREMFETPPVLETELLD